MLRMAPRLFCLYTLVAVFYDTLPESSAHRRARSSLGKERVTFSDKIISVRHHLWMKWVFEQMPGGQAVLKLPTPFANC